MTPRGKLTLALWLLLWSALTVMLACEALDAVRRAAPPVIWLIKLAPLLLVLPFALRDGLRAMIWLSFISLLYFLFAVQRLFAEPASLRAQLELLAVVIVFLASMFYTRYRARERRAAATGETP